MKNELFGIRGASFGKPPEIKNDLQSKESNRHKPKLRRKATHEQATSFGFSSDTGLLSLKSPRHRSKTEFCPRDISHVGISGRIFVFQVAPGREFEHIYLFCAGLFIYLNC